MRFFTTLLFSFLFIQLQAQNTQAILVEHFTNTNCSVCGARNPALFDNLDNHPEVIHLSYYPSSPYSDCKLNNQNKAENDSRTKYYGIYGSTPQIVVNGKHLSGAQFTNTQLFDPFADKTTPFRLVAQIQKRGDSLFTAANLLASENISLSPYNLLVLLVEDTVFYQGRNSEKEHYHVFRTSTTGITGSELSGTLDPNDAIVYEKSLEINSNWKIDRLYLIAILQDRTTKEIIQTGISDFQSITGGIESSKSDDNRLNFFPNPANEVLYFQSFDTETTYTITSAEGKTMQSGILAPTINIETLEKGIYIITFQSGTNVLVKKLLKN